MENIMWKKTMKKIYLITLILIALIGIGSVNAETYKINQPINLFQTCNNCSFCSATVLYPNSTMFLNNVSMIKSGTNYNYSINSQNITVLGIYDWHYTCGNAQETATGKLSFEVTTTGQSVSLSNIILVLAFLTIGIIIFIIGYSFDKEKYLLKSGFYLFALILCLLAINSARIIASESSGLSTMGLSGIILVISIIAIMFLYIFITWMVNTFRQLKDKKETRWNY